MDDKPFEFLQSLLNAPGVSGYEQAVQDVVRNYVKSFADEVRTDSHGNVIACVNPKAERRLMFAGHCDQIGLLVAHIDENGFLFVQTVGGWDPQQLVGQRMTVWTAGGPINGIISRKAIHLLNDEERKQVVKVNELWIDIGAKDEAQAREHVQIGDSVTLQLGFQKMLNDRANAPAMDDRTGLWVCIEGLRRAAARSPKVAVYAASTVQEEIGLRGAQTAAYGIDPHVGIAVDVTHATDCPGIDLTQRGKISLGQGPVIFRGPNMNPRVVETLFECAKGKDIPYQVGAIGRAAPNDSNALQLTRAGVASGLVAVPNRYMHSAVETISLSDIDHAANLLAEYACALTADCNLIP